ncbi:MULTISPECIES: cyclase family protein [unclassified Rhodococcus (in: high G+C Gram-positive bacteria)]|uniref:cyclase family protein n=1 Tax=unclassified Rhodococcus (in: high G+C Gram-positive bacteria) TaxID=192944 RepID=UPI00163AF6AD|nr:MULTISPECIES: cyclase family protein [unclassified Rhodococcus (in: high G+C Gram-positive bacteria)]MBC2640483.1 cyclase family protein [Rhodococcus sp. 3A]MBC2894771.1 cyclase family protein [Rhodococcus sp. 4CII]
MTTSVSEIDADATYADLCARTDGAPAGSSWGVFDDPDRGTANFAGPRQVREAAALVERGAAFALDYPLGAFDPPMARSRTAPKHTIVSAHAESRDDLLDGFYLQASSHLDGLRHRRVSGHGFYDGVPDGEIVAGTPPLGIQAWSQDPIVGRGVLIDLDGLFAERGRPLDHHQGPAIDAADLDAALTRQGCEIREGDLVLVHTGWANWYLGASDEERDEVRTGRRSTGFAQSREFPQWLWDNKIALFATDTFAVEVLPVLPCSPFTESAPEDAGMMHQELIGKLGVPLGELWNLTALVEDSRRTHTWDALVTVKPLNFVGGVGSPCNATAVR